MRSFSDEWYDIIHEYRSNNRYRKLEHLIGRCKKNSVCIIYGAGMLGHTVYNFLTGHGIRFVAFCDDFITDVDCVTELPVISSEELLKKYHSAIIILAVSSIRARNVICDKLALSGFNGITIGPNELVFPCCANKYFSCSNDLTTIIERYESVYDIFFDDMSRQVLLSRIRHILLWEPMPASLCSPYKTQYFDSGVVELSDDEVLIDGGFYNGDSTMCFIDAVGGKYKHVFGFEPDNTNIAKYKPIDKVTVVNKALWSHDDSLRFNANSTSGKLCEEGSSIVLATSIDCYFEGALPSPTFIKLDIEGAEKEALTGGIKTITTHKPKLAVCVYHNPEHMYELPKIIRQIHNYKFSLRHYSDFSDETVLYCT